ncbi:MFS transporter [Mangrovimicrobium sediminis]|uniref:MFS transporter n=1 Tax=Mangrovimicrobium sediminis TaxID=2562682 RepID=A0A4Z0LWD8_9GAMM|nr:MFS transporter [Haliea sp. SAOS-164]TGD71713.1 MFS transporter [Haliea sp. SAOS-164]
MRGATSPQRLLARACDVRPGETAVTLASFVLVLLLMASYYLLRPVRDAMASDWSDAQVSMLWTGTFFFSLVAVSAYGAIASRIALRHLVPGVYAVFAASFGLFWLAAGRLAPGGVADMGFYVWVSVFSLFHISVFWSFMADTFTRAQSKRLFAFIGAGASVGGLLGPAAASVMAQWWGSHSALLAAACLLLLALPLIAWVQRLHHAAAGDPRGDSDSSPLGGNPLSGFADLLRSRYLLGICLFIFLYTAISSFVYFELKNLLEVYDRDQRTRIWANMDLVVNCLTLLVALFATGRIASRLGLPFTLASVPVLVGAGLLSLAAAPQVAIVLVLQVARRVGNYAITRPAREMLFTAVGRRTRYKTKPVIDIVVYRGGDMLNAWAFTALTQGFGLGMAAVAVVGAAIAALWAVVGIGLGRGFERRDPGEET